MRVRVQSTFNGSFTYFTLIIPHCGGIWRESVRGEEWSRSVAIEALDILESVYGEDRTKIRFEHI